ncbi:methylamine utilization protein MauG [Enterovibrio norvegicus]|uniref:Cytochrome-c peroxidase n=1 Tax=Enterovibrio norvegicus TaxID=188144 RepID=A0ABV4L6G3_9GAMM|nr:cytochrome c peroxidase [Enterovibrio norvegicus]OEF52326.1 methylamine utilization protein MauG [Enterovibrio norvegicus]OEF55298.1 methylamine utilization protein MauG [Enterovibrio norvegicus]
MKISDLWLAGFLFLFSIPTNASTLNFTSNAELDAALRQRISQLSLTGDPLSPRSLPSINTTKAQLGKLLFFSKIQSGNFDTACVSCHHPMLGGADALSIAIGVDTLNPNLLGPGREHRSTAPFYDGGPTMPRNVPTSFNLGFWDKHIFHDGRVEALLPLPFQHGAIGGISTPDSGKDLPDPDAGNNLSTAQAAFPQITLEEMRGFTFAEGLSNQETRERVAARMRGELEPLALNQWPALFRETFNLPDVPLNEVITPAAIREVLAEYMRSQVFVDNPWFDYVQGNTLALTPQEKRGAFKFLSRENVGGFNCQNCHSGNLMTDEGFHNLAMPQLGRGKGDSYTRTNDFGRYRETYRFNDLFAFRTPSLLNVEVTGPYGHAGAYGTLEDTIRHHMNPTVAIARYQYDGTQPSVQQSDMQNNSQEAINILFVQQIVGVSKLNNHAYNEEDIQDLAAFLRTLTDPCVKDRQCMAPWLVDNDIDPDGLRIEAVDINLQPL